MSQGLQISGQSFQRTQQKGHPSGPDVGGLQDSIVPNEDGNENLRPIPRLVQGGVVGDSQIPPEPVNDRVHMVRLRRKRALASHQWPGGMGASAGPGRMVRVLEDFLNVLRRTLLAPRGNGFFG